MSKNYAIIIQFVLLVTTFYWSVAQRSDVYLRDIVCDVVEIPQSRMATTMSKPHFRGTRDTVSPLQRLDKLAMLNHEKKIGHRDCSQWAHSELTVTKKVTASRDWAVTWTVIELWPNRDWAVIILKMPWLSCDLAVTELWSSLDWAVTSPWLSCDLS